MEVLDYPASRLREEVGAAVSLLRKRRIDDTFTLSELKECYTRENETYAAADEYMEERIGGHHFRMLWSLAVLIENKKLEEAELRRGQRKVKGKSRS